MIHMIYVYLIIGSFIAGITYTDKLSAFLLFLFWPLCPLFAVTGLISWLDKILLIKAWYNLYFTSYYKDASELFIKIRRQQYHSYFNDESLN